MGRRKRLCITSTEIPERECEPHETTEIQGDQSNSQGHHAVATQGDQPNSQGHHAIETRGDQSSQYEISTNEQGARKKVRGYTQKAETWKMNSNQKIVVTFNKFGKPVGDEGNELVQFLGTLVRMHDHVSIEYTDWRKVPIERKEDMYSLVKSKFVIHPSETDEIKKWIFHNMGKIWRTWKGSLKACAYDPSLTIDEIVAQQTKNDNRVNPTQFKELVTRWFDPEFQSTCDVRRSSRSKMNEPHVTGTKSFARLAHEVAIKNNGVYPTRGEMYVTTRTRKDGSIVDDKAAEVVASLKAIASDSTSTPGDEDDFINDDYSRVKGPEKRGYVRLVGRIPSVKKSGDSSTDSQTIHQLKSVVNVMLNIIQEDIPNANLLAVLNNMNIEVPGISLISNNLWFLTTLSRLIKDHLQEVVLIMVITFMFLISHL